MFNITTKTMQWGEETLTLETGKVMEARVETLRAGGSLFFGRGGITADGVPCLNFSGTLKRLRERAGS